MPKLVSHHRFLRILLIFIFALSVHASVSAEGPEQDLRATPLTPKLASHGEGASLLKLSEAPSGTIGQKTASGDKLVSVIVKLEDDSLAAYTGGVAGLAPTSPQITGVTRLDLKSSRSQAYLDYLTEKQSDFEATALKTIPSAQVIHRYQVVFGGVSMLVPSGKVQALSTLPGVKAVYHDEVQQIDTEVSPFFIGAGSMWRDLGGQESAGEGIIVGVLDTGVWPEHPSYSDPDPVGKPYAPPPVVPGANGFGVGGARDTCDFGNTAFNPNDVPFTCNNKLIGAYAFIDTYKAVIGLLPAEFDSARDDNGHGTHTSSTAAGNANVEASMFGVPRGTVSGIAPRAHVIAYRVCADEGCFTSDSVAAVEQAILDGIDVINFSISGGGNPYSDAVSQAFLDAYAAGVFVSASAGNSGPGADTVNHREPWTTTVGASTTDRHFLSTITLTAHDGDTLTLTGASVTNGISTPTPVVLAEDFGDKLCLDPFPPGTFNGQIVVCERGDIARVEKSFNVAAGGAGGMILYNPVLQGLATDNHFVPSVHIENDAGAALLDFMTPDRRRRPITPRRVMGTFTPGLASTVQGDVMAAFSSRGGPGQSLGVSKPDVTAPGVQILAGHTPLPATVVGGLPGQLFQAIQGTSMSAPHVAGAAALIKDLHPDWTPGQIKSALMTTATTDQVFKEDGVTPADPFDFGSGRIDLSQSKPGNPGLTFDETATDYVALQDELWNSNYPSLYVPVMPGRVVVSRTIHSELGVDSTWETAVTAPPDVHVTVPPVINLPAGGDATFDITVDARDVPLGEVRHATLHLTTVDLSKPRPRGITRAHFPITIVRQQPAVTLDKVCDPASISVGDTTECTITITNNSLDDATVDLTDKLRPELDLVEGSVVGATQTDNAVAFEGTLFAAGAPTVDVAPDALFGYISLAGFGITPLGCPSNCDDGGFIISGLDIDYLSQHYTNAILSVNGTLELGTASGVAASATNQNLPDPALPNNVLAPWWTDLNLGAGGNWYIATLSAGPQSWDVFEWENVPRSGDPSSTFTFQIWLERGTDNIHFVYGPFSGDTSDGTTGAENDDGTVGDTEYFDGTGTLPWSGPDLGVATVPGTPGETHVITFDAEGTESGWVPNCAEMTSDAFFGTNIACFDVNVNP